MFFGWFVETIAGFINLISRISNRWIKKSSGKRSTSSSFYIKTCMYQGVEK
jgi:hypothetical protein